MTIDYDLIIKVIDENLHHLGDDSDQDNAYRRVLARQIAEAVGLPLEGYRLLMERDVIPKYRTDYSLAPCFICKPK